MLSGDELDTFLLESIGAVFFVDEDTANQTSIHPGVYLCVHYDVNERTSYGLYLSSEVLNFSTDKDPDLSKLPEGHNIVYFTRDVSIKTKAYCYQKDTRKWPTEALRWLIKKKSKHNPFIDTRLGKQILKETKQMDGEEKRELLSKELIGLKFYKQTQ